MSSEQAPDKEEVKREYGCPCGKTYLSYPALFTHVKQKHDGKAPGSLIKPKTQKARGRPKLHIDAPEDDMSDGAFDFEQELSQAVEGIQINYNEQVKLSQGSRTCQDMASSFLNKTNFLGPEKKKIFFCFINELKYFIQRKSGQEFWSEEKPSDIIEVANDICRNHQEVQKMFPIPKKVLHEIIYVFFRWMYKNKWTDHKLIKRAPVKVI